MTSFRGLTLSLITHALLFGLLLLWADLAQKDGVVRDISELLHPKTKEADQTIIDLEIEESKPNKTKAQFSAENTHRVKEQSQARFMGPTVNKKFPNLEAPHKPTVQKKQATQESATGTMVVESNEPKRKEIPLGISTIQSQLDNEIKYGDFTSLNTDQNLFFSFYTRIGQRIRYNWESGVVNIIESLYFRNLNIREEKTFVTQVEVQIDPSGKHVKTSIYRSSGIPALDAAVTRAFLLSTPFVNPPKEMVRDDGLIHLYYNFRVPFSPQYYARPQ